MGTRSWIGVIEFVRPVISSSAHLCFPNPSFALLQTQKQTRPLRERACSVNNLLFCQLATQQDRGPSGTEQQRCGNACSAGNIDARLGGRGLGGGSLTRSGACALGVDTSAILSRCRAAVGLRVGRTAIGRLRVGGLRVWRLRVGRLRIRRLCIGRLRVRRLRVGRLRVGRLRVRRLRGESRSNAQDARKGDGGYCCCKSLHIVPLPSSLPLELYQSYVSSHGTTERPQREEKHVL